MQQSMPLPKYHQVYLVLKERLLEGFYNEKFPGELELTTEFEVSRVTIRKALSNLASEGLIERTAGRGTRRVDASGASAGSGAGSVRPHLLDKLVAINQHTTVKVLEHERISATESVAAALQVDVGAEVLRVVRLRSTSDGPVSYIVAWLPAISSRGLTKSQLERKPILTLIEEAGVQISSATQTVSARQADSLVARHLAVPVGTALLAVSRIVFDGEARPVQWLQGLYRPDRYEYEMKLSRSDEADTANVWISKELTTRIQ
ncbi:GntR family transcriptional regulator [Polaromonas sp. OV174]|uniref:GntR family transcriptional regulator n=1 Tax=Polaromonas sp. OV174 TaxID=1855300 RepID=UPI0008E1F6BD|nr:GntR family transcriptional regulator [Polaromonas sp. OV174]SFC03255.1 GntR family transcriptional regulator [Polaromonas sp. OV174]